MTITGYPFDGYDGSDASFEALQREQEHRAAGPEHAAWCPGPNAHRTPPAGFALAAGKPVDQELFNRTAPQWNCVDHPGEGMHYTPHGDCLWCGMTKAQITLQRYDA
jgi:hypothetical protein